MSADNYYFVRKREDGKFGISHRWASCEYADEITEDPMEARGYQGDSQGWKLLGDSVHKDTYFATIDEARAAATRRPDWIVEPPEDISDHETLEDAIVKAHFYVSKDAVVEYGVIVQEGLLHDRV